MVFQTIDRGWPTATHVTEYVYNVFMTSVGVGEGGRSCKGSTDCGQGGGGQFKVKICQSLFMNGPLPDHFLGLTIGLPFLVAHQQL